MEHEPDGPVTPPAHDPESLESPEPPDEGGLPPEEEPTTTGTLFIMIFFLMALAGMWGIMYLTLLNR
ncbi:MAG: hypothetical protein R3314_03780 [Longimicrobiales bacterium]|nr:hypothetical protein [Longimicrobiales bacterium]